MGKVLIGVFSSLVLVAAYSVEDDHSRGISRYRGEPRSAVKFNVEDVYGVVPTVFTPLRHDMSVDLEAIPPYADFLIKKGVRAVLVGGTSGEHMSLTVEQRKQALTEWVRIGKETGLYIISQVGAVPFAEVREMTRFSVKIGVNAIMTLPEVYFKPRTVDELVSFVSLVAAEAPHLPIFYYHAPNYTGVTVNQPAFAAAASERIPNFRGIKFADSNFAEAYQTFQTLRHDQAFFLAPELEFAAGALVGIKSLITPILNVFPVLSGAILEAVQKSDLEKARYLQEKLALAAEAVAREGAIPAFKAAMEIVTGLKMGPPALPQMPISFAARERIENAFRKLGLI